MFTIEICPYRECHLGMKDLVVVDTAAQDRKLVYLVQGTHPAWQPMPAASSETR